MSSLAGAEIGQLDNITLDEDILGFDIAVKDAFFVYEIDGFDDLEHVVFNFLIGEGVFFIFEALIHVHVHEFENEGKFA